MAWPGTTDYSEAVQDPGLCFRGTEFANGAVALNQRAMPLVWSGNFACVYSVEASGRKYAVRCFTREPTDQQSRYNQLSEYLINALPPSLVHFEFMEHGISVRGDWYPIVRMEWVEGETLNEFVGANLQDPGALRRVAAQWRGGPCASLRGLRIAHNDLQHGNVMVQGDGAMRLVDYDGMFLPQFRGERSPEMGHGNFQHPQRTTDDYDAYVDNFPSIVIYLSLLAVASDPSLWDYYNHDNLIFTRYDYTDPANSELFDRLRGSPDQAVSSLAHMLGEYCSLPVKDVPNLETVLQDMQQRPTPTPSTPPMPPTTSAPPPPPALQTVAVDDDSDSDISDIREVVSRYAEETARRESHSICLIGCGEAGSKLAGVFRLQPDFVPDYLPMHYPVRAAVMDTQSDLPNRMNELLNWRDTRVQLNFAPPPPTEFGRLLGVESRGDSEHADEEMGGVYTERSGGAGGFTLLGRASAIYNFVDNEQATDTIRSSLDDGGVLLREDNGYLITFSGLGGGTGSGSVPIVTEWMQRALQPPPTTTFSLCVLPESHSSAMGVERGDPRQLSNLLTSLYYLAKTPSVNGVLLADNLALEEQGHKGFLGQVGINRYLQDVLMPLFLSAQTAYHFNPFGTQLDAANVRSTLSPRGDGLHEFIAAGFSLFPLGTAPERIRNMAANTVEPELDSGLPTLTAMLEKALENTLIDCEPRTARNAIALLSGPERQLRRLVPGNNDRVRFEGEVRACLGGYGASGGSARFFMANFPEMTDLRLTVLLGGPRFPRIEQGIGQALDEPGWAPREGESLADAIRRLSEQTVLERGVAFLPGIRRAGAASAG